MAHRFLSPAGTGLLAGWLTSAGIIALSVAGLLPAWASMPLLLFGGGLAAGLAAPVRPTIGALLGAVAGIFTGAYLTIVLSVQGTPASEQYVTPFPIAPVALALVFLYTPTCAIAGALGAAVRTRLSVPRPASIEQARRWTPELRQWVGIAGGALCIIAFWAAMMLEPGTPFFLLPVFGFAGGVVAGSLSCGGARAGVASSLLSGIFGLGVVAIFMIWQSLATGGFASGLWPIAIAIMGFMGLPTAALGGAIGGSFRKPA